MSERAALYFPMTTRGYASGASDAVRCARLTTTTTAAAATTNTITTTTTTTTKVGANIVTMR